MIRWDVRLPEEDAKYLRDKHGKNAAEKLREAVAEWIKKDKLKHEKE